MKTLTVSGETYEAERIVKTTNSIIGYNGETEVFAFRGINDFNAFELEEGKEWDTDPYTDIQLALVELADLILEGS